jgi:hypothetical protein
MKFEQHVLRLWALDAPLLSDLMKPAFFVNSSSYPAALPTSLEQNEPSSSRRKGGSGSPSVVLVGWCRYSCGLEVMSRWDGVVDWIG